MYRSAVLLVVSSLSIGCVSAKRKDCEAVQAEVTRYHQGLADASKVKRGETDPSMVGKRAADAVGDAIVRLDELTTKDATVDRIRGALADTLDELEMGNHQAEAAFIEEVGMSSGSRMTSKSGKKLILSVQGLENELDHYCFGG